MNKLTILISILILAMGCDPDKWLEGGKNRENDKQSSEKEKMITKEEVEDEETGDGYKKNYYKIGKKEISSLKANIEIPTGLFRISSTPGVLADARFRYREDQREPKVDFEVIEERGILDIRLPKLEENLKNEKNVTSIKLQKDISTQLHVAFGAGKAEFELADLLIHRASFEMGAGEFEIKLPPNLEKLDFDAGVGSARVDLTGSRKVDLDAEFNCGIGELTVYLPADIGIKARVSGAIGGVTARGFTKKSGTYTNKKWDETNVKMTITINGGIGEVKLKMEE